ncbi:hypothetical protein KCG48_02900 [Proteiniclasticum sp. BAD-10]|uniref:Uncharacterized protein n=1 Tax=Proteiniclasticum sediminis TaxID=2804028 RepID=A0A941CNG0_9CLOT|nr:hypothetical protein [Proteiniclasticum sediminis]MBR0575282.1 hypothetical protein [Proteiniclasticum sediminis]
MNSTIEKYIYAVTKYLPEKDREDVARELSANIEDMLEGDRSEDNIRRVLEEMGSPYELAIEYSGKDRYLIGPVLYPIYLEVLKIIAIVAVVIGAITFAVDMIFKSNNLDRLWDLPHILGTGIGNTISILMGFFFWVTVIFAIVERNRFDEAILKESKEKFKVSDLKDIPQTTTKKISKVEMGFALFFTILFLWIFVFRSDLLAIYINGNRAYPIFNSDTIRSFRVLILLAGGFSLVLTSLKMIFGRWNPFLGILASIYAMVNLAVFIIVATSDKLFNAEFLKFVDEHARTEGFNIYANLDRIILGILIFSAVATLIEIGTSLYNGFRPDKSLKGITGGKSKKTGES